MQKADLTSRAVAAFIDLLLVIGLARLPDVIGVLAATGYILIRDGLFENQSVGKKLIGVAVAARNAAGNAQGFRESILRNTPLAVACALFLIPYAGWVLGPLVLGIEGLVAVGDDAGMRIGDLIAGTQVVRAVHAAAPKANEAAAKTGNGDDAPGTSASEPRTNSDSGIPDRVDL